MKKHSDMAVLLLVLSALVLRAWTMGEPGVFRADESMKIPAAENYVNNGHMDPDRYFHPPLKFILIHLTIKIFGNNPFGWRILFVISGTMTVFVLFLLGRELFGDKTAYMSAALLAVDPVHIMQSRTAVDEVIVVLFFLISLLASIRYFRGNNDYLAVAGVFLGLSIANKLYFLPDLLILPALVLIFRLQDGRLTRSSAANICSAFILLPLSVYLLSYFAWFGRGYNLWDFIQMQLDSYRELQSMTAGDFAMGGIASGRPIEWLIQPLFYGFKYKSDGGWSQYHVDIDNFPVWMLTIPAVFYTAYRAFTLRDRSVAILTIPFIAAWLQILAIRRPLFVYSSVVVLPFTILSVSYLLVSTLRKFVHSEAYYKVLMTALILWGLYLYPLALGRNVPDVIYAPLLSIGRIYNVR